MERIPEHTFFLDEGRFLPSYEQQRENLENHPFKREILQYLKNYEVPLDAVLSWSPGEAGTLSDLGILRHMLAGNVIIHPFNPDHLNPNSYDVSLGEFYYSGDKTSIVVPNITDVTRFRIVTGTDKLYNPRDEASVKHSWQGPFTAQNASEVEINLGARLIGIDKAEKIIVLLPQEMVLCHTQEFIGGRNIITTEISGKSTTARNFLEVCSDASSGDIGYVNRWTLEIVNKSDLHVTLIIVGERYAQIVFKRAQISAQSYSGNYQEGASVEEIERIWIPEQMLPKVKPKTS